LRAEFGRCVASLIHTVGDVDLAEDAVQEAFEVAVARWPGEGGPPTRVRGSRRPPATARSIGCGASRGDASS
jgi:hypothetical protein